MHQIRLAYEEDLKFSAKLSPNQMKKVSSVSLLLRNAQKGSFAQIGQVTYPLNLCAHQ